jgi:DnaD/phage-associated family protein
VLKSTAVIQTKRGVKMAERRMFSKTIIDSDLFLDMPVTAQLLYFHLCMRADDDGFINNPKRIMRDVRCSDDDMKMLVAKDFIIPFESGVIVIKHWRLHNYIRKDRRKPSQCLESSMVRIDERGIYQLDGQRVNQVTDNMSVSMSTKCLSTCQPSDIPSIDKSSIDKGSSKSADADFCDDGLAKVMDFAFSRINPSLSQGAISDLKFFYELLGADVTIHAMQVALDEKKTSWSYIRAILRRYKQDGLDSLQKVMEAEEARNVQKAGKVVQKEEQKPVDMEALKDLLDQI